MLQYLYVALGSAAGGVARWSLGGLIQRRLGDARGGGAMAFPAGTLVVNVSGSFLLGVILMYVARHGDDSMAMRLLLAVGFCGGYTTFSTFSYETLALIGAGSLAAAAANVVASVGGALIGVYLGTVVARLI